MKRPAQLTDEPLIRHWVALRSCVIRCVIAIALAFCVTVFFARDLYAILAGPLRQMLPQGSHFITLHPVEAWYTYFKTALYSAAFLVMPVIFYQIWRFVSPGLYERERRTILWCALLSSICFMSGGIFGYFVALPAGFNYFNSVLTGTDILFLPRMEDYLGFAFQMLLAFGLVFELPLLLVLLNMTGLITAAQISGFRRYYIVLAFIIAAVLTPPDILSQILMGLPLLLLYEVGYGLCRMNERKRRFMQPSDHLA